MSRAVICSDSDSAGLAIDPVDPANSATITISVSKLVPDSVDDLPSLALLTSVVLYSLDLGSSMYLLLVYLSYFSDLFFLNETALVFLIYLAILRILYRPIKKQVRLRILI